MAKIKIGDVVEIKTSKGLAYAQYTHKHKQYGALLRVFDGFYSHRPTIFTDIVNVRPKFSCFFPLTAAVDRNIVSIAGNVNVSNDMQVFPTFRAGVVDPSTKKVATWWLWDGEEEWRIGSLSENQRQLPIRGVWNDTFLIERIESGWTPETDPT